MVPDKKKKKYQGRIPLPEKTEKTHEDKTKYNRKGKGKFDYRKSLAEDEDGSEKGI